MNELLRITEPVPLVVRVDSAGVGRRSWDQLIVSVNDDRPGAVAVARRRDLFLLVQHPRPVVGAAQWEFPRGFGATAAESASPEDPVATARRELLEETGHEARTARAIGSFWPDTGLLTTRVVVVLLEVAEDAAARAASDTDEVTGTRWSSAVEIDRMVAAGTVRDGMTLAAWALVGARAWATEE